jgi:hypothetical protein
VILRLCYIETNLDSPAELAYNLISQTCLGSVKKPIAEGDVPDHPNKAANSYESVYLLAFKLAINLDSVIAIDVLCGVFQSFHLLAFLLFVESATSVFVSFLEANIVIIF